MSARLEWYGDRVKKSFHAAALNSAQKLLLIAEGEAKKKCPIDTGRLRASITHAVTDVKEDVIVGQIGTNVDYAAFVEFGTSKTRPHPYIRPGIDKAKSKMDEVFQSEFKKVI